MSLQIPGTQVTIPAMMYTMSTCARDLCHDGEVYKLRAEGLIGESRHCVEGQSKYPRFQPPVSSRDQGAVYMRVQMHVKLDDASPSVAAGKRRHQSV